MRALEALADGEVAGVRAAVAERDAEALAAADRDVGAELARAGQQRQREQVGGDGAERAALVGGGEHRRAGRAPLPPLPGYCSSTPKTSPSGRPSSTVDDLARRRPSGSARVCMTAIVCGWQSASTRNAASAGRLAAAAGQRHRLGGGGALVEQRRAGDRRGR